MTGTGENTEGGGPAAAEQPLPWLLEQKISVPERAAGYFHRGELVELTLPTQRCVTVLMAPGGFGKTTLLAECCRLLAKDGVPTAWVSLDDQDEPGVLDSCIAFACESAGLDIADGPEPDEAGRGPESRAGFVLQAIAALGRPFVLAFDGLERLANPASVALLDFLVQHAPGNLHLALACRHLPAGLNIAGAVLEGRAAVLTTDQQALRQARSEHQGRRAAPGAGTGPAAGRVLMRRGPARAGRASAGTAVPGEAVPTRRRGGGVSGGEVPGASASRAARAADGAHRPEHPGRVCVYGSCL